MKKVLISFFTICLVFLVFAEDQEEEITPYELFSDEFSDNSNEWSLGDEEAFLLEIKNGKLTFEHKETNGSYMVWNWTYIDGYYDFKIETSLQQTAGPDNYGYGLMWGVLDVENYYTISISDNGFYAIGKMLEGTWSDILSWKESSIVNTNGSMNKLTLEKKDKKITFYINGNFAHEMAYQNIPGDGVGYVIWNQQTIEVDYLKVVGVEDWFLDIWDW